MSVLNFNVGVLGHVDSGKTSLAKALSTIARLRKKHKLKILIDPVSFVVLMLLIKIRKVKNEVLRLIWVFLRLPWISPNI